MPSDDWEDWFSDIGAFWLHDQNPKRPYVELTNLKNGHRQISNGYFNGAVVQKKSRLFGSACTELAGRLCMVCEPPWDGSQLVYVIAAEKGGAALSVRLGEALDYDSGYAEKQADGKTLRFGRFSFEPDAWFILGEDTITSGDTVGRLREAAKLASPRCNFYPFVLAFCNRSGKTELVFEGMPYPIIALVNRPMLTWNLGENPFTPDGQELVPPLKAGKENWYKLTRHYD